MAVKPATSKPTLQLSIRWNRLHSTKYYIWNKFEKAGNICFQPPDQVSKTLHLIKACSQPNWPATPSSITFPTVRIDSPVDIAEAFTIYFSSTLINNNFKFHPMWTSVRLASISFDLADNMRVIYPLKLRIHIGDQYSSPQLFWSVLTIVYSALMAFEYFLYGSLTFMPILQTHQTRPLRTYPDTRRHPATEFAPVICKMGLYKHLVTLRMPVLPFPLIFIQIFTWFLMWFPIPL